MEFIIYILYSMSGRIIDLFELQIKEKYKHPNTAFFAIRADEEKLQLLTGIRRKNYQFHQQ